MMCVIHKDQRSPWGDIYSQPPVPANVRSVCEAAIWYLNKCQSHKSTSFHSNVSSEFSSLAFFHNSPAGYQTT